MERLTSIILMITSSFSMLHAQVWEGRNANFPASLFGGGIYAIDDSLAWCWGVQLDTSGLESPGNSAISKTTDGGLTWQHVDFPSNESTYITSLWALNDQTAWMTYAGFINDVQTGNYVLKTTNGGQTWDPVNVTVNVFVDFIYMWSETEGVVVGDPDDNGIEIYKTIDGGNNWDRIQGVPLSPGDEYIFADNYEVKGNQLWFATSLGRIFHSADKGLTWEVWDTPLTGYDATYMDVSDEGDVYLIFYQYISETVGAHSFLFRRNASDGQWVNITEPNDNYYMYDIKPIPGSSVVMSTINAWLGNGLQTRISYDRGNSWIVIDNQSKATYFDFYNPDIGYASEFNLTEDLLPSLVYRYTGSPLTGLIKNTPLPDVELSITPNPTSDFATITMKANYVAGFYLLLNDLSGKLILKKEYSGVSEIYETIDLKSLPVGAYMVTIANEKGIMTEKLFKK